MDIKLEYKDNTCLVHNTTETISHLAFTKHLTFAGAGVGRSPFLIFRYIGIFFECYQSFSISRNHFTIPTEFQNDPTEVSYCSNRIGKALADYFSKKLLGANFTHCYEDAMIARRLPVIGIRPDFYCDNSRYQFAIEAKGTKRKYISNGEMLKHKIQSQSGGIPVHFTAASVSYNIYNRIAVKFHDPINDNIAYDQNVNAVLRSNYLQGIIDFLEEFGTAGETTDIIDYYSFSLPDILQFPYRILIHRAIVDRAWESNTWLPSNNRINANIDFNNQNYYIDNDGIGLLAL